MRRRVRLWMFMCAATAAGGCFDARRVDPGAFVFDDFDDGTFQPADPDFKPWGCLAFNPDRSDGFSCDHDEGYASEYSLYLNATINDAPDGLQQYGGAMLLTLARTPADLTSFKTLTFAAKLELDDPALAANALLYVELGCTTAPTSDGSHPDNLFVTRDVDYQSSWLVSTIDLADFVPPSYQSTRFLGGLDGCLRHIDGLHFTVQPSLPDGQSTTFTLHVDNIRLQ